MPAVSGSPTQLAASVLDLTNLGGLPDDAYKDGDFAYVQSTRATYQLDRTSAATPSSVAIDTFSGNGQWVFFKASTSWGSQATWYIDPATGDDENDGNTTGTALETWAEFARRVETVYVATSVYILSNMTERIGGFFRRGSLTAWLRIEGVPTVLATGGGALGTSTFIDPVPATNTRGSVAVTNLTTSAGAAATVGDYVEKILRSPEVSASGPFYWPVMRNNAGTGEGGYWARPSTSNTKPSNDAVVEVLDLIQVPTAQFVTDGLPIVLFYLSFTTTNVSLSPSVMYSSSLDNATGTGNGPLGPFVACQFAQQMSPPSPCYIVGCHWKSGATRYLLSAGPTMYVVGGGCSASLRVYGAGSVFFQGFHIEGGQLLAGTSHFSGPIVLQVASNSVPMGVFASTTDAVEFLGTARMSGATIYGAGSTLYGFRIGTGAQVHFTGTPTVTGGSGDLIFNGAATAIPPLTATAVVPAASALTTWVQWAAAPFSRNVFSYTNGTKISGS